jgi:hypothetical protein
MQGKYSRYFTPIDPVRAPLNYWVYLIHNSNSIGIVKRKLIRDGTEMRFTLKVKFQAESG